MATFDLTVSGGALVGSKNYVNSDAKDYGTFTVTSMSSLLPRVIDGDRDSYWQSETGSDATTEVMTFSFNSRSAVVSRTFDLLAFTNINWKNFLVESSTDAAAWTTVTGLDYQVGVADLSSAITDLIVNVTAGVTASYLRVSIYRTQTANAKKILGGIWVFAGVVQLGMDKYDKSYITRGNVKDQVRGDGSLSVEYIFRSAASYEFYSSTVRFPFVSTANRLLLRNVRRDGDPFVFVPFPQGIPRDVFLCLFKGDWKEPYASSYTGAGFNLEAVIEETGGA